MARKVKECDVCSREQARKLADGPLHTGLLQIASHNDPKA